MPRHGARYAFDSTMRFHSKGLRPFRPPFFRSWRDRLHQTLDYNGGNMEKFPAAKEGDDRWKPVRKVPTGGPGYGTMDVNMPPSSAAQMDKVLTHLGLPVLTP